MICLASPMVFPLGTEPWHRSEGACLVSSLGWGADEGCVRFPQLRGGRNGFLRHGAGWSPAEIPGPHPCAGGGAEGWAANWGFQVREWALQLHRCNQVEEAENTTKAENMQQPWSEWPGTSLLKKVIMEGLLKHGVLCTTAVAEPWPFQVFSGMKGTKGQSEASPDMSASKGLPVHWWLKGRAPLGFAGCWVALLVPPAEWFALNKAGWSRHLLYYPYIVTPAWVVLSSLTCSFGS